MTYPDPPQFSSASLDLGLSSEPYSAYPRSASDYPTTTMGYDSAMYAEAPYVYGNGKGSPGLYPDDSDMHGTSSDLSIASASSSNAGSPMSTHGQIAPVNEWTATPHGLGVTPGIVDHNDYFPGNEYAFTPNGVEAYTPSYDLAASKVPGFVDPSLIHPEVRAMAMPNNYEQPYSAPPTSSTYPTSPALSVTASPQLRAGSTSPFGTNGNYKHPYSPFQPPVDQRRGSLISFQSNGSTEQPYSGDESREKQRCPHPDCGKYFKDLKAHMLTHQSERPEKCPIVTCEYHIKGFARKYDKNRHTLTHYKGTMVCGFCPGSGSPAEKSFNRADVFKRHLTAVHGVEQTPPNSRKKGSSSNNSTKPSGYAPDATGKCSTCSETFSNAQDFYEHLDDCVLRIVQQEDPAEAVNAKRLAEVENDPEVVKTLTKNNLPVTTVVPNTEEDGEDEHMEDLEGDDMSRRSSKPGVMSPTRKTKPTNPPNGVQKSRGMTHSRGGVPLIKPRSRKNRQNYPQSWGFDKGQMTIKKRVLTVFDGPRRLAKDDMMLSTEQEVRIRLQDKKHYITDLDLQTLKRAEGFLNATVEEKGPWISDDPTKEEMNLMLELSLQQSADKQTKQQDEQKPQEQQQKSSEVAVVAQ